MDPTKAYSTAGIKSTLSFFQLCHRFHPICLQNSLFFPPRKVCFTEHSIHTVCSVLLEKSSLSASMCGTLIYQSHSAADGTSASQRSWLHWGILEDKSHLLSCTRARTNTDKVWQLLACFTTAATRNSSFHP